MARHGDIGDDQVGRTGGKQVERAAPIGGRLHRVAFVGQHSGQDLTEGGLVIDNEDPAHAPESRYGRDVSLSSTLSLLARPGPTPPRRRSPDRSGRGVSQSPPAGSVMHIAPYEEPVATIS